MNAMSRDGVDNYATFKVFAQPDRENEGGRATMDADVRAWLALRAPQVERLTPDDWTYAHAEDFVLRHGAVCPQGCFTDEERRYVFDTVKRARLVPRVDQCWRNARQALVLGDCDRRLTYCEGFVAELGRHHGWLQLADKVVDITLSSGAFGLKALTPKKLRWNGDVAWSGEQEYFGVAFARAMVEASSWREPFALADYGPGHPSETLQTPWTASHAGG